MSATEMTHCPAAAAAWADAPVQGHIGKEASKR